MSQLSLKYKLSNSSLLITVLLAIAISWFFKWKGAESSLNFMGGDAKDYYSGLVSTFITHDLANQSGNDWFLLRTSAGTINVHPVGVSLLLLPFFGLACLAAFLFHFPVDGFSFPFQLSVAAGALTYALIGLVYLKKLCQLRGISDATTALILLLTFFGTNVLHYTLSEAGMSHVYSFGLISVFLYHSSRFVKLGDNKNLVYAFLSLGAIVLVRPNNILILFSVFIWFRTLAECRQFFCDLFKNRRFYVACLFFILIVCIQSLVWFIQSKSLFHNTYVADGFYWLNPQLLKMLFGFDGGFFVYTPLCLLFLAGLIVVFRENWFSFYATALFLLGLFYFFASYWAYTYFDGLGIRVLVDYYALFSFLGARLFEHFVGKMLVYNTFVLLAAVLLIINLIYTYQANSGILLRAGMTYTKWKYIFLKTGSEYKDVFGGSHELKPYSPHKQEAVLQNALTSELPFDYTQKDYGLLLAFDSLGFQSNRIQLQIDMARREKFLNASKDAALCISLEDGETHKSKMYAQFRLNEAPATHCCDTKEYTYTANFSADFQPADKLSVFVWNTKQQAFLIEKFSVKVYNYGFKIN